MRRPGLGLALDRERPVAVLVSATGEVLGHRFGTGGDPAETAHRLLNSVLSAGTGIPPDRVVIATEAPLSGLMGTSTLPARVGVLRIGAPATTSVPPLTGWPEALARSVSGPISVVRGGHRYDGRELAALDLAAVRAFGLACVGTVDAVAVAGTDAQMNPDHELRACGVLGELLGGIPIVTGHDVGGTGLLERENTAALGAAVAPATQRFTEAMAAAVSEVGLDADLYLVTGQGTVLPASRAVQHPLALLGAAHAATRTGAARMSGQDTLVVVEAVGERLRVSALVHGRAAQTGLLTQVAGVRTSMSEPRVVDLPADTDPATVAGVVSRVRAQSGGGPVVGVGIERDRELPDAELAAALGAALGEASGSVDRVFFYGEGGLRDCVDAARREARELAVRHGADPRRLRVGEVREAPMTYVPVPCVRLRVTATGPLAVTGTPA